MSTETIEIIEIDKKSGTSTKTGKPYSLTKIKDGKTGREGAAFGAWSSGWKIGDTVEVIWKENGEYKGVKQWLLDNPQQAARAGSTRGSNAPAQPDIITSYQIAAVLAPLFFEKGDIKLAKISKLAAAVHKELESVSPAPEPTKEEKAPEPTPPEDDLEEDLDDDDDNLF